MSFGQQIRSLDSATVRRAFGNDPDHPAVVGKIIGTDGDDSIISLRDGSILAVSTDDKVAFHRALKRKDFCRHGHEPLVLLNPYHGLLGLGVGPSAPPRWIEIDHGAHRPDKNGSVAEIVGRDQQPGWLLFRCHVQLLHSRSQSSGGRS